MMNALSLGAPHSELCAACTIVVPQFDGGELTRACVASLRAHERVLWPVVVVEDGGEEGRIEGEGLRRVRQEHAGVTAAWNGGAAAAETPFLVFLNNDTLFCGAAIEGLIEPLLGGAVVSGVALRRERGLPRGVLAKLPCDEFVEGWCFAVARAAFERVGGFDPAMRVYWSDTDLQCRLVRGAGSRGMVVNGALPVRHLGHRTVRRLAERRAIWEKDRDVFVRKWNVDASRLDHPSDGARPRLP